MTNFWEAVNLIEEKHIQELEHRVYYDKSGNIKFYTSDVIESNYEYMVIDIETYDRANYNLVVQGDHLVSVIGKNISQKLVISGEGTLCDKEDISIVANNNGQYWELRRYE